MRSLRVPLSPSSLLFPDSWEESDSRDKYAQRDSGIKGKNKPHPVIHFKQCLFTLNTEEQHITNLAVPCLVPVRQFTDQTRCDMDLNK